MARSQAVTDEDARPQVAIISITESGTFDVFYFIIDALNGPVGQGIQTSIPDAFLILEQSLHGGSDFFGQHLFSGFFQNGSELVKVMPLEGKS